VRSVTHFLWLQELSNIEISRELEDIYGKGMINLREVQRWTHRFVSGDESLEDKPRSGRPLSNENVSIISQLLTENLYLSQKTVATMLNIHYSLAKRIFLKELLLRKVNFKWIPHSLNDHQKQERVRLSKALLQFLESKPTMVLAIVYTGDETRVRYDNPRSFMWAGVDIAKSTRVRPSIRGKKLMIWVCFSLSGIDSMTALPAKETFACPFFIDKVL
jgi:transposase